MSRDPKTEIPANIVALQEALESRDLTSHEVKGIFDHIEKFHEDFQKKLDASTHTQKDAIRTYNL